MTAPTLTEFLLARIAEDGAEARRWEGADAHVMRVEYGDEIVYGSEPWVRVLAECEAKRAIITDARRLLEFNDPFRRGPFWDGAKATIEGTLWRLAAFYAEHPDFNEAWRP